MKVFKLYALAGPALALAAAGLGLLAGCPAALLDELSHMSPVSVISYSPSAERVPPSGLQELGLSFSSSMNRVLTEKAFSFSEGSKTVDGRFAWSAGDDGFAYRPVESLRAGVRYTMALSSAAEDRWGNSLERDFSFTFFTGAETDPPVLVSVRPADGAAVGLAEPISLDFSEPIRRDSFYTSFSIEPEARGAFAWSAGDAGVVFTPAEPYAAGREYLVTIGRGVTDLSGNALIAEARIHFTAGVESRPSVASLTAEACAAALQHDQLLYLNPAPVEKDETFLAGFSEAVPPARRLSAVSLSPAAALGLDWLAGGTQCRVRPAQPLVYGTVYSLSVLDRVYRFKVSGPNSVPPRVAAVYWLNDLTENPIASFEQLIHGGLFDHGAASTPSAAFDVYIERAPAASVGLGSFIQAFSLTVQFAGLVFELHDFELAPAFPAPPVAPAANQTVVRVKTALRVPLAGAQAGTMELDVGTGLSDSMGNRAERPFTLILNLP